MSSQFTSRVKRSDAAGTPVTPKLLCLCDSPTLETGFARVASNLLTRWHRAGVFADIWVWGIGYHGFPHDIPFLANRICPATTREHPEWSDPENLRRFLLSLRDENVGGTPGGFTHIWIMQDMWRMWRASQAFAGLTRELGVKSFFYFPVDAPLQPEWTLFLEAVSVPVAYGPYGHAEADKAKLPPVSNEMGGTNKINARRKNLEIHEIPHGVDTSVYFPIRLSDDEKQDLRRKTHRAVMGNQATGEDFLIIGVGKNQPRKRWHDALVLMAEFGKACDANGIRRPKLYLHCSSEAASHSIDLKMAASQLGLVVGKDVFFGDKFFSKGHPTIAEAQLNLLYNSADLLLSTAGGEGWGLPITEAMAAGLAVAAPRHSAVADLLADGRGVLLPTRGLEMEAWDNSRLRPALDVENAVLELLKYFISASGFDGVAAKGHEWATSEFLNWDRIAREWLELFELRTPNVELRTPKEEEMQNRELLKEVVQ